MKNMAYEWKIPGLYPVSATVAGAEFEKIYSERGELKPAYIVDESRPKSAPLHICFEWNDAIAAEKYREDQAGGMIRAIVTVVDSEEEEVEITTRAFVSVMGDYKPTSEVMSSRELTNVLLNDALRDANNFRKKYESLCEIKPIIRAIDNVNQSVAEKI